jgi:hypothetical protein
MQLPEEEPRELLLRRRRREPSTGLSTNAREAAEGDVVAQFCVTKVLKKVELWKFKAQNRGSFIGRRRGGAAIELRRPSAAEMIKRDRPKV